MIFLALACVKPVAPPVAAQPLEGPPALASYDHNAREHYLIGQMQLELGQLEAAEASFRRALLFDPDSAELQAQLDALRALSRDPG